MPRWKQRPAGSNGQDAVCPWHPDTVVPVASAPAVASAPIAIHDLPASAFGHTRAVNLPSTSVRIGDLVAAVERAGRGRGPFGHTLWQPDAALYRRIVAPDRPGLCFVGLIQPIGPTVPLVEVQARWTAAVLAGAVRLPDRAAMRAEIDAHQRKLRQRYVDSPRYTLEVDYREHAGQISADLGTTP